MLIDGHTLKVNPDSTLTYRGKTHPLAGAHASHTETRRGIPLVSRRTLYTVTVEGAGFYITGPVRMLFPAFRSQGKAVRKVVTDINSQSHMPA